MIVVRMICLWLLASFSSVATAKECFAEMSCEFRIDSQWTLIRAEGGGPLGAPGKEIVNTSMQGAYVMLRGGEYYLVREGDSAGKSFVIVPIIKSNNRVLFDRVVYFSIEMQESARRGYAVWSGDELSLSVPRELSKFSWELASEWQNGFGPGKAVTLAVKAPNGFRSSGLTIHDEGGKPIARRIYVYPDNLGATPESLVCFESCPARTLNLAGALRGGIGGYPIEMSIAETGSSIRGTYRYLDKNRDLHLMGESISGSISLAEYLDGSGKKLTGKFSMVKKGDHFEGIWVAQPSGRQLSFFAAPDGL
ncbi:hypothetical protein NUV26_21740 [Burkholderia pseudomultivorans]|uniref:hypothetical protein n=1 Tax=Burkholderia pseudomultivorans TaxID=1207504 RepID=UPI0028743025|nr:hypothetical protein [Burkholderia pseudomultivorans]MDS0794797.1 hypothetical protein [Burkholderia pseudomultivorans]